jgi:kynurenine formamidase
LAARALITKGEIVRLGYQYTDKFPRSPGRSFALKLVGRPTGGPGSDVNGAIWNDDFLTTEIGQIGTHMDALGHFGCYCAGHDFSEQFQFYNGNSLGDTWSASGLKRLGIENAPDFFVPATLFDIEGLRGAPLERGEQIELSDLLACLERQRVSERDILPGDALLVRTGHAAARAFTETATYYDSSPGIGLEAAEWLAAKQPCVVGADNCAIEVLPNPNPDLRLPCHQLLIMQHGIYLHENMKLDSVADRGIYRFAYVFAPIPIVGATGSIGTPIAVL